MSSQTNVMVFQESKQQRRGIRQVQTHGIASLSNLPVTWQTSMGG